MLPIPAAQTANNFLPEINKYTTFSTNNLIRDEKRKYLIHYARRNLILESVIQKIPSLNFTKTSSSALLVFGITSGTFNNEILTILILRSRPKVLCAENMEVFQLTQELKMNVEETIKIKLQPYFSKKQKLQMREESESVSKRGMITEVRNGILTSGHL